MDADKANSSMEIRSFFSYLLEKQRFFELKEQIFHKMAFFVCIPVCISRKLCGHTTGDDNDPALLLHPAYKLIAVITLIC